MRVEIQNPNNFDTIPNHEDIDNWVISTFNLLPKSSSKETSIVLRFVDAAESQTLNFQYRKKNAPTNVLSFINELPDIIVDIEELKAEGSHLGDLVLCEPVIKKEANEQKKTLTQHWAHMIIHGVLHLNGYDHIDENDAIVMENLEIKILEKLGFNNPYQYS